MIMEAVSYPAALIAGVMSFFSPCILPLIPAYFTLITGLSLEQLTEMTDNGLRKKVFLSTLAYVAGFSSVFVLMGASATMFGKLMNTYKDLIRIMGASIILIMGLHMVRLVRIPFLDYEKRFHVEGKQLHFFGVFMVGMAFGAGWSPCIGPLLGTVLILAGGQETVVSGMTLLGMYALGLALPFVALSFFIHFLVVFVKRAGKTVRYLNLTAGILLILIGGLLMANKLAL